MTIEVETSSDPRAVVRRVLDGADEALLGIAFVQQRGVNLIERQMNSIGTGRLISTATPIVGQLIEALDEAGVSVGERDLIEAPLTIELAPDLQAELHRR